MSPRGPWRALAAAIVALAASAAPAVAEPAFDPSAVYDVPLGASPRRGPDDAPITIVEFSDFTCAYCNRAQATLEQLERLYPGKVRWVFRHRPLDRDLTLPAEAAAAAGLQGRFWPMHDRLFAAHGQVDRAAIELHAAQLGLDLARFRADLDSGRARAVVAADGADGDRLGLTGTPTFFVNGRPVMGARGLPTFALVFAEELARARRVAATRPPDLYAALIAGGRARADVEDPEAPKRELDTAATYRIGLGLPGHSAGPDDALVTVVVWSDLECPYCARLAPTLARLRAERAADVRLVLRHLPLTGHDGADLAAEAVVEAGRTGKAWALHDLIFASDRPRTRAMLLELGERAGVDPVALAAALDDHRHRDVVLADGAAASALGTTGTPTLFVNGRPLIGAVAYETLVAAVDEQLAAARELLAVGVPASDVYALVTRGAADEEVGDPRRRPRPTSIAAFELGPADREAAILAACRAGDGDGARALVPGLPSGRVAVARAMCRDRGVELP